MNTVETLHERGEEGIRSALSECYPRLWRYALMLTRNRTDAADLTQAACLRVMEKSSLCPSDVPFDRWLFRLTHRVWLNELRSQAVRRGEGITDVEDSGLTAETPGQEMTSYLRNVFSRIVKLPEEQRSAVMLVYVEQCSYREAAEILDVPIGTIMSRLASARAKLKKAVAFEQGDLSW